MDTGNIAVVMFFLGTFSTTFFILYFIYRSKKEKYELIKHAINNNYPNAHLLLSNGYGKKQTVYISNIKKIAVAAALLISCCFDIGTDIKIILLSVGSFFLIYGVGMILLFRTKKSENDNSRCSNNNKEENFTPKVPDKNNENSETADTAEVESK